MGPNGAAQAAYQQALMPYLGNRGAENAARAALGAQYVGLWADAPRQGWAIALAPGALDAETGKAAIVAELSARYAPEQAALLSSTLTVLPSPYSEAELVAVRDQVAAISASAQDFAPAFGIGCTGSDAYRVEVRITQPETPEAVARAQALFGQFGDKVQLIYGWGGGGPAVGFAPVPAAVNARKYATVPKAARCVRGRFVGVRAADDAALRSVTLTAGKRAVTAKRGQRAKLALKSRSTRVTLTVSLRDGRTTTQSFTYRRCG